jgi:hypothetical protein
VSANSTQIQHIQQHNTGLPGSLQQQQQQQLQQVRLLSVGTGCWLSHMDFDGQRHWTLSEDPPEQWLPLSQQQQQQGSSPEHLQQQQYVLPSDSQHRQDLVALRAGDVRQAQQLKEHMEQQQRRDAKARPAFALLDCVQGS